MSDETPLPNRYELFAQGYAAEGNATKAAIEAGYSERTAYSQGHRLLKHAEIKARIDELVAERAARMALTGDNVLKGITEIAWSDKATDRDKLKAFDLLGRHLKLWTQKHELGGLGGGPIDVDAPALTTSELARRVFALISEGAKVVAEKDNEHTIDKNA